MAREDSSPEKRLLEIIEGQEGKPAQGSVLEKGRKIFSLSALKARISFFREKLVQHKAKKKTVSADIKVINLALKTAIVLLVLVLGLTVKIGKDAAEKGEIFSDSGLNTASAAELAPVTSLLQPQDYYLSKVKARNIFEFADKPKEELQVFKEEVPKVSKLQELSKDLKLVGISWSDNPDAIVEDSQMKKTYFIQKGSMINDIRVKDILKDRIILRLEGEEVELR